MKSRCLPMDETALCFLLDQNIPIAVSAWLKKEHPEWIIHHVNDKGLEGSPDNVIFDGHRKMML
jgi:hypothetical protein